MENEESWLIFETNILKVSLIFLSSRNLHQVSLETKTTRGVPSSTPYVFSPCPTIQYDSGRFLFQI